MTATFKELPGWNFEMDEVSAGVYEVVAYTDAGLKVTMKGTDPDALLLECKREIARTFHVEK